MQLWRKMGHQRIPPKMDSIYSKERKDLGVRQRSLLVYGNCVILNIILIICLYKVYRFYQSIPGLKLKQNHILLHSF